MTLIDRIDHWGRRGDISPEQQVLLRALVQGQPFSLFLELNVLLYVGVLAIIGGLSWTIKVYAQQLGNAAILTALTALLGATLTYCFRKADAYRPQQITQADLLFDYILYLSALTWSLELGYLESHYHLAGGHWDIYLLMTACFFFALAYRFDNRFVLSMALSTLAAFFGLELRRNASSINADRVSAILYSGIVLGMGASLKAARIKAHFSETYFNFAANILFIALLSGVFTVGGVSVWTLVLAAACVVATLYGIRTRRFIYVAYASVYGYLGISSMILRGMSNTNGILLYLVGSGLLMIVWITRLARHFTKDA